MSLKQKSVEQVKAPILKPRREPFKQNGVAVLFKSRDATIESAKGLKILPLLPDGKPDWKADGYILWFNEIDSLRRGTMDRIGVFLAEYRPKPAAE